MTQTRIEILRAVEIKTTAKMKHDRPDIVVKMSGKSKWQLIHIAVPLDHKMCNQDRT